ncbi:MAG: DNA mismatch repair protein MutS, partial [candidate division WOR-3 bacterium]
MHLTPLLEQYQQIKNKHKDTLLLFRVGDFYEFYYDDAKKASVLLGITLTSKTISKGIKIPLAGIPVKASENYIAKLVKNGIKVAICEQLEPADKTKKLVARDVTEVITPGTILRPSLLDENKALFVASCIPDEKLVGVAICDITTGDFTCGEIGSEQLNEILMRKEVKELILPQGISLQIDIPLTTIDGYHFIYDIAYQQLKEHFNVITLDGFGVEGKKLAISAAGALLYYLKENQRSTLPQITKLNYFDICKSVHLDSATRKNLELVINLKNEEKNTLYWAMDNCLTPAGKRLLRNQILEPLIDCQAINERLDGVAELKDKEFLRKQLREFLKNIRDVERITARLMCARIMPREMNTLKDSLRIYPDIKDILQKCDSHILKNIHNQIEDFTPLVEKIEMTISPEPPATLDEPGSIKFGYSQELDELRKIARNSKEWLVKFQTQEREKTGINSLKVAFNTIFGYYIEISKPNLHLVPSHYIRKQTLANAERFYTPELKEFEEKI